MADNHNPPIRGKQFVFALSLASQADARLFQLNPTLASGDVKISKLSGTTWGAYANLNTLPSVEPAAGDNVKVIVSATEMTADAVKIKFSDAAGAEWCDLQIVIHPTDLLQYGTVNDGAPTATGFVTTITGLGNDAIKNAFLQFVTGALAGQAQKITGYTSTTGAVTTNAFTAAPANGDAFVIIGKNS